MASIPPPNEELAELAMVLGDENVRMLVRTFLRDFPSSMRELATADRKNGHRIAHSMKSNSRLMGAHQLSQRMAELEARLSTDDGGPIAPDDLVAINSEYAAIEKPLQQFAAA